MRRSDFSEVEVSSPWKGLIRATRESRVLRYFCRCFRETTGERVSPNSDGCFWSQSRTDVPGSCSRSAVSRSFSELMTNVGGSKDSHLSNNTCQQVLHPAGFYTAFVRLELKPLPSAPAQASELRSSVLFKIKLNLEQVFYAVVSQQISSWANETCECSAQDQGVCVEATGVFYNHTVRAIWGKRVNVGIIWSLCLCFVLLLVDLGWLCCQGGRAKGNKISF